MTHHDSRTLPRAARALGLTVLGAALAGCGITGGLRGNLGYARFGKLDVEGADREFALSLGPLPLKIAKVFVSHDPELASLLKGVRAVRVYSYAVEGHDDDGAAAAHLDVITERLVREGWDQIVAVRDDGERVAALVRMAKGSPAIRGVAVVVYDEDELMLVNVIGNIRPQSFGMLMAELDLDLPAITVGSESPASAALSER